jgi:ubiquinone/menaquinone biosynthesis C-methylase UbiE
MIVDDPAVVAQRLCWVSDALHAAAATAVAHRVGLLAALKSGPARVEQLAAGCLIDARSTAVLIDALAAMGLVERIGEAEVRAAVPELPTLGAMAEGADLLVEAVRSGRAPLECDEREGAARVYPDAIGYLGTLLASAAHDVADVLGDAENVLDVGAGAAPWSLAVARRNARCRVTAIDLAPVIPVTRRAVAASGCAKRFEYLPGDVFEVSVPEREYDLVLLGNVCHLFDGPTNLRLLRRLRPAIRDGGRIAIVDAVAPRDPAAARSVRLYAVGLMTRTSAGGVHGEHAYRSWLAEAGYAHIQVGQASRTPPMSVMTGSV